MRLVELTLVVNDGQDGSDPTGNVLNKSAINPEAVTFIAPHPNNGLWTIISMGDDTVIANATYTAVLDRFRATGVQVY